MFIVSGLTLVIKIYPSIGFKVAATSCHVDRISYYLSILYVTPNTKEPQNDNQMRAKWWDAFSNHTINHTCACFTQDARKPIHSFSVLRWRITDKEITPFWAIKCVVPNPFDLEISVQQQCKMQPRVGEWTLNLRFFRVKITMPQTINVKHFKRA